MHAGKSGIRFSTCAPIVRAQGSSTCSPLRPTCAEVAKGLVQVRNGLGDKLLGNLAKCLVVGYGEDVEGEVKLPFAGLVLRFIFRAIIKVSVDRIKPS